MAPKEQDTAAGIRKKRGDHFWYKSQDKAVCSFSPDELSSLLGAPPNINANMSNKHCQACIDVMLACEKTRGPLIKKMLRVD